MTTISAKSVESSVSEAGVRLDTIQLRYPWWIHPELLTHRVMARNASSVRARPVLTVLADIEADMAVPLHWGINEKGMQAHTSLQDVGEIRAAIALWREAGRLVFHRVRELHSLFNLHKQVVGRLLQPFSHADVIVSATDWENFFALRCHPDTEPHMRALAWKIADVYYTASSTKLVRKGDWHLPYVSDAERQSLPLDVQKQCSAARCARVSYRNHDGASPEVQKDQALFARLIGRSNKEDYEPSHLSPLEHQATPLDDPTERSGPFLGWKQHRKEVHNESMPFDYQAAVTRGWRDDAFKIFSK